MPAVLLAHDETCVRNVLAAALRRAGLTVLTAADGTAALEVACTAMPDLIVSHYRLPGLGGPELCIRLLGRPATRSIPVLLMVPSGISIHVHHACPPNLRGVLTAPLTPTALVAGVQGLLAPARSLQPVMA